jgi:sugar lactone lactonase YvrE
VAVTGRAVYFTDFTGPFLYKLPLSTSGALPDGSAVTAIPLMGTDATDPLGTPQTANGIVSTANGKTLIIGDSNTAQIYRVDPGTGMSDRIVLDTPLTGFIDGIARSRLAAFARENL